MIDFSKLGTANTIDTLQKPREIYISLPNKPTSYQYPRDVQSQVWNQWYERRTEQNLVLKMNTGSGKTVVGLMILKSCLNENVGPAVYVVPDNYLVDQVIAEANKIGISVTDNEKSIGFLKGKEILVINIKKLVNGKSVFGVGDEGIKINIGSIIIDDAHACISSVEEQFTIKIGANTQVYGDIRNIFDESLKQQSVTKRNEIFEGYHSTYMQVPFWTWQKNISKISEILAKNKDDAGIKFSWPLIKEHLKLCSCVISGTSIEISPHVIPINTIPTIENIKRKIFMTATLADNSILATHFNIAEESITRPVVPETAGDIGERMILIPQELNPRLTEEELKMLYKSMSKEYNVVVIVPSFEKAKLWNSIADLQLDKDNLYEGVEQLKTKHVGLVVLVNRYDGVDLPQEACRILIIDGLPESSKYIDSINEIVLQDNEYVIRKKIQKIEQGMGRGIRSNDDYCVVFLMGQNLIHSLYDNNAKNTFSPGTRAQIALAETLSEQLKDASVKTLQETVDLCLQRNQGWVVASKSVLPTLTYDEIEETDSIELTKRKAFNLASINHVAEAVNEFNICVNAIQDKKQKGYMMQSLAEYINLYDSAEAQKTLRSAISNNSRVLKPLEGITYQKIKSTTRQASNCKEYLLKYLHDKNKLVIDMNDLLESLVFLPDTANRFEEAMKKIAFFIGFNGQRPETEYGRGPDNLWALGESKYFVIECKNGVTSKTICKHDINQLNGSMIWFEHEYDGQQSAIPIMIHLGNEAENAASPHSLMRIMTSEKLDLFKQNIQSFILAIKDHIQDEEKIGQLIITNHLTSKNIIDMYTVQVKSK